MSWPSLQFLLDRCRDGRKVRVVAVCAQGEDVLFALDGASREGIVDGVLVGGKAKIEWGASALGISLAPFEIVDAPTEYEASEQAVRLVLEQQVTIPEAAQLILQAGAMGLPVICSHITGNIDIITNNETGLIFDSGNEEQLLKMLQYAILHPQHLKSMAEKLQQEIKENYRQENIWQNILAAYKTLVN